MQLRAHLKGGVPAGKIDALFAGFSKR